MGNTFGRKLLKADVAQLVEQPIRNRARSLRPLYFQSLATLMKRLKEPITG